MSCPLHQEAELDLNIRSALSTANVQQKTTIDKVGKKSLS